jgi:hypothetical protein
MTEITPVVMKLTNQFRSGRGMMFAFRCNKDKLTLCISPRENGSQTDDWCAEARTGPEASARVVREWGPTRAEALAELGRSWASRTEAEQLPVFDWEAVATALNAVRAL